MKKAIRFTMVLLIAVAFAAIAACDLFEVLLAPTAKVVDAKTGNGISGVTVTLTPLASSDGKTREAATATSGSDGAVIFTNNVKSGKYTLAATSTGYVWIEQIVDIAGWNVALPTIYGLKPVNATDISIFATWKRDQDVDSYLTYNASIGSGGLYAPGVSPYSPYAETTDTGRIKVYHANTQTTSAFANLDHDSKTAGNETITIRLAGNSSTGPSTPNPEGLSAGTYEWLGTAFYYLTSYTNTLVDANGNNAEAMVYVTQGTAIKAVFEIPQRMLIEAAKLIRIQIFADASNFYVQFFPDTEIYPDAGVSGTGFRGLGDQGLTLTVAR